MEWNGAVIKGRDVAKQNVAALRRGRVKLVPYPGLRYRVPLSQRCPMRMYEQCTGGVGVA